MEATGLRVLSEDGKRAYQAVTPPGGDSPVALTALAADAERIYTLDSGGGGALHVFRWRSGGPTELRRRLAEVALLPTEFSHGVEPRRLSGRGNRSRTHSWARAMAHLATSSFGATPSASITQAALWSVRRAANWTRGRGRAKAANRTRSRRARAASLNG